MIPVVDVFGAVAGAFNIGSFVAGSGPEALHRYKESKEARSIENQLKLVDTNIQSVMKTLEEFGRYLTRKEYLVLLDAYLKCKVQAENARQQLEDAPIASDYKYRVYKLKMFTKLAKETRIREQTQAVLERSIQAEKLAVVLSNKRRLKHLLKEGQEKPRAPSRTYDASDFVTESFDTAYPPSSPYLLPQATESFVSLLFDSSTPKASPAPATSAPPNPAPNPASRMIPAPAPGRTPAPAVAATPPPVVTAKPARAVATIPACIPEATRAESVTLCIQSGAADLAVRNSGATLERSESTATDRSLRAPRLVVK
ncbi:hypothetical protein K438DRAFT_1970456 [Mycena galopus ATCC 62051]|nr:hypothetical protein K438DRAFT_1970456 [Mycena galopus ATCC 62051]